MGRCVANVLLTLLVRYFLTDECFYNLPVLSFPFPQVVIRDIWTLEFGFLRLRGHPEGP